jgi:hypothetical protein
MARKVFDIKFIGADLDKALDKLTKEIAPNKWQGKKNGIVNKGLKEAANAVLPTVWNNMRVGSTGRNRMFTSVKRVRGGGWRISTPRRNELELESSDVHKEMRKSGMNTKTGYYPASMELGFKHYKSKKMIEGDHALKDAMDTDRQKAIDTAASFYKKSIEKLVQTKLKKKIDYSSGRKVGEATRTFDPSKFAKK